MAPWTRKIVPVLLALGLLVPSALRGAVPDGPPEPVGVASPPPEATLSPGQRIASLVNPNVRLARDRRTIYWSLQSGTTEGSAESPGQGLTLDPANLGLGELVDLQQLTSLNLVVLKMKSDREEDLLKVLEVINALDRPKKQVLVRVIVAEFELSTNRYLRTQARAHEDNFLHTNNLSSLLAIDHSNTSVSEQERINSGYELFLIEGRRLEGYLATQKTSNRFHVVSEPHVVVNHGNTAQVFVGKGYNLVDLETTVQGQQTITTFKADNIGLSIGVTPYIYSNGRIGLKLDEQFSDLLILDKDAARKRTERSNRELHTFATVPSGYTLVLGGMLQRRNNRVTKKVPGLSRIPVIKNFFEWETRDSKTIELVLFITPVILDAAPEGPGPLNRPMETFVRTGDRTAIKGGKHATH